MNDDELLRNRAYRAEAELEEQRRFCTRCYEQHRYTLQTLHAKLTDLTRELAEFLRARDETQKELAAVERELAEARALLARWRTEDIGDHSLTGETDAFLRRDEGPCPCLQWEPEVRGSRSYHVPGCEYAPARDEGER